MLHSLLDLIHRDAGETTQRLGLEQSVELARESIAKLRIDAEMNKKTVKVQAPVLYGEMNRPTLESVKRLERKKRRSERLEGE